MPNHALEAVYFWTLHQQGLPGGDAEKAKSHAFLAGREHYADVEARLVESAYCSAHIVPYPELKEQWDKGVFEASLRPSHEITQH